MYATNKVRVCPSSGYEPDLTAYVATVQWGKTAEQYAAMLGRVNIREVAGRKLIGDKISEVLDARHEAEWHAAQETAGGD